jgi:hypothetical protein
MISYSIYDTVYRIIPLGILLSFIILTYLIIKQRRFLKNFIFGIDKKTWSFVFIIFLIGLLLRLLFFGHWHMMYTDEFSYMESGKNMLQTGSQVNYVKSIGWPFMLSLVFGIFGVNSFVALYTSSVFGALTILVIFLLTYSLTKNKNIALLSSLILSLFPLHLKWSGSAETNITSLFFILLALFFCFLFYNEKNNNLFLLAWASVVFAVQFRPENYVLIFLFLLGIFLYNKEFIKRIDKKNVLAFLIIGFLCVPNFIQVFKFQTSTNWAESDSGGERTGDNWSIKNLVNHSIKYGIHVFDTEHQPITIILLFLTGIFCMFYNKDKNIIFLLSWFFIFWVCYFSSWEIGGFERVYTSFYPILAIVCSYGVIYFIDLIQKIINRQVTIIVIVFFLIFSFVPSILKTNNKPDDLILLETRIPEMSEKDIPKDCLIVATMPEILRSTTNLDAIGVYDIQSYNNGAFIEDIDENHSIYLNIKNNDLFDKTGYVLIKSNDSYLASLFLERIKSFESINVTLNNVSIPGGLSYIDAEAVFLPHNKSCVLFYEDRYCTGYKPTIKQCNYIKSSYNLAPYLSYGPQNKTFFYKMSINRERPKY